MIIDNVWINAEGGGSPFSFLPQKWRELEVSNFFLVFKLTLLWPLKMTHIDQEGGHDLMVFLPPWDFSFLLCEPEGFFLWISERRKEQKKGEERSSDIENREEGWIGDTS